MLNSLVAGPDAAWPLIRRILAQDGRKHLPGYALAFAFMIVVAATTAGSAYIMESVINEIFIERDQRMVWIVAGTVLALFLVKGAASYGQQVTMARIGNAIVASIQRRIYRHVLAQDLAFFQRTPLSDLITRMSHNAQATRHALDLLITSLGRDLLTLIGLSIVMIVQDPAMSVIALLIAPPAIWAVARLMRRIKGIARAEFAYLTHIVSAMQETALGVRVVKAFNLEDPMRARMDAAIENVRARSDKIAAISARTSPLMETLGGIAIACVILYGGWSVVSQDKEPGAFFSFITALLLAYEPAKRLARLNVQLRSALVGVGLMYDLIDTEPALREAPDAQPLTVSGGRVALSDVRFAYGEAPALRGLSLEAAPGRVTALVGPSGAGKSTVFNLIERFSDPESGRVLIDGQDLRNVTLRSLREQIAFVSQDTFLFDGTVAENIACGRLDATREEIETAAKHANAHDFIFAMRGGYDAPVGEGGGNLSGGQRQRIAIARAMLRDAPILLLDEATSALDAEAEAKVQDALERLMRGRTTLVIAHRLSTVRRADMIHVLDRGVCVQSGDHDALLREGGLYAHLHALQFRGDAGE